MHYLMLDQCRSWAATNGVQLDPAGRPIQISNRFSHVRFLLPQTPGQLTWLCRFISRCLEPRSECLLWVTETGVWPSSENWHVYYRLRQSYGDLRQLQEAPGHLFLNYESADLATFLQVGLVHGWDMFVLPRLDYGGPGTAQAFISHDEWVLLSHREASTVAEWHHELQGAEYRFLEVGAA